MTLQQQIRANRWRTVLLLLLFAAMVGLFGLVLTFIFDPTLLTVVGVAALLYAIFSWFASGSMVGSMTGAQRVDKHSHPEVYRLLENVAIGAGLEKTPELRLIEDSAPNAFAAGRNPRTAYVAVTTGLIELMEPRELEGVLAHEVAHIRNRDVRLMTLVAVLVGVVVLLADVLLRAAFWGGSKRGSNPILAVIAFGALLLAPVAAVIIQLSLSRRREYLADASAAEITNDAEGMALALRRLLLDQREIRNASRATAHLYIESPLHQASGARVALASLFETHPPLEKRIAALEDAGGFRLAPLDQYAAV
jgi:heat shock protein HtpX